MFFIVLILLLGTAFLYLCRANCNGLGEQCINYLIEEFRNKRIPRTSIFKLVNLSTKNETKLYRHTSVPTQNVTSHFS